MGGTDKDVAVYTMQAYKRISGPAPFISTSALVGHDWSVPRLRPLYASGSHGIGGWVTLTAVCDALEKRKISSSSLELNVDSSVVQPIPQSPCSLCYLSSSFMWKPEGKRVLGRPESRLEDNVKMVLLISCFYRLHIHR